MNDYNTRLRSALLKQHQLIFDYNTKQLRDEFCEYLDCPVCDSSKKVTAFTKDWFTFSKCCDCGMVYLNPRLNDKATYQFYNCEWNAIYNEQKFGFNMPSSVIDNKRNYANLRLIERLNSRKGKLLEIGIGNGFFLKKAHELGYEVYGVELNKKNCEMASSLLEGAGKIYNSDLFDIGFESNTFDVIYMKDVFEHVPNPKKMLAELSRIAKKGCILFIEVPNIEGWIYKIVKQRHVCVFAFEHLNYWSRQTLSKALDLAGFEVHSVRYESDDFTPAYIISYLVEPSFTSLELPKGSGSKRFMFRCIKIMFSLPPLKYLDYLFRWMPDFARRGSMIKVLAIK